MKTLTRLRMLMLVGIAVAVPPAHAQLNLPQVRVPQLPLDLPVDANKTVDGVTDRLDLRNLADLRRLKIVELVRTHRDVIETDPQGAAIVRSEITAFSPSDAALNRAREAGFTVLRENVLAGLDAKIVVLQSPSGMSTRRALQQLRKLDPQGTYDFNHLYSESGEVGDAPLSRTAGSAAVASSVSSIKVGLIDGGVDTSHAVFRESTIHQHGCGDTPVPSAHGTAVASLIAGHSAQFHGAAPSAVLYAADVYCGKPTGGAVDAVADAFAWLSRERVPTINVSLVGPPNVTLQSVVRLVTSRGYLVIAAVGNDGPAAPPLYPASYPDVVGVTGVDIRRHALIEAARGKQVDFAAPGADMAAASTEQTFAAVRGTSFAAPIVAGLLAMDMTEPDKAAADRALQRLMQKAVDLGSRGVDSTYGNGLVGNALRIEPALANAREK